MSDYRINCLFVIDDLGSGGSQRQMVETALQFAKLGYNVNVAYYFMRDYYEDILISNNIKTIKILIGSPLKRILKFRHLIRKGNYDYVISYLGVPNFICELASIPSKKWRLIVNERSADPKILSSFKSWFIRLFHLSADNIVCNSVSSLNIVRKVNPFIPERKLSVIYNMIDPDLWKPLDAYQFRKSGQLRIVVAASQRYLKNLSGLLKALLLLTDEEKRSLSIDWYGDRLQPPFLDNSVTEGMDFIERFQLNDIIRLFPATKNIKNIMLEADVIALFSFFEGLPNSICEGMALGKPVIASSVSDIPLIIEDGINGKLCNPGDPESIAAVLRWFSEQDNEKLAQMGRSNRKKAVELFDKNIIMDKYLELIK